MNIFKRKKIYIYSLIITVSIILAAILASVLYFCLKKVLETCDCLNNANCLHGKCVCLSGYSGDRCQNCRLFLFIFITQQIEN